MDPTFTGDAVYNDEREAVKLAEHPTRTLSAFNLGMNFLPMSGVRCPTCAANGQESWVIPGKNCPVCGTGC